MPHSNYCTAKFRTSILMTRTSGQRRFREVDIIFEEVAGPCAIAMPAFQLVPSTCVDLQQSWQACPRPWLGHTGVAERGYVNLGPFKTKNVPGMHACKPLYIDRSLDRCCSMLTAHICKGLQPFIPGTFFVLKGPRLT